MQFTSLQIKSPYRSSAKKRANGYSSDKQQGARHSVGRPNESYRRLLNTLGIFLFIVSAHTLAMIVFEGLSFKDALWLTLTTVTTVGYGDLSAQTNLGRLSTVALLYIGGIALLAKLVAEYIEYRIERRERQIKGIWEWKGMKEHLLIINTPEQDTARFLSRLIEHIKITPSLAGLPIQILSSHFPDGLPNDVIDAGVVHVHGNAEQGDLLSKANIEKAKYILVIARSYTDTVSDSINFDILNRIEAFKSTAYVVCEVVDDQNRQRFRDQGADSVLRPIRAYPEIITRALEAPGTEQVLENLFTHRGDFPQRFDVIVRNMKWSDLALRITQAGLGIPLGYIDAQKKAHTNPPTTEQVTTNALIILVHEENTPTNKQIQHALNTSYS